MTTDDENKQKWPLDLYKSLAIPATQAIAAKTTDHSHSCPVLTAVPVYGFGVAAVSLEIAEVVDGDSVGELLRALAIVMLMLLLALLLSLSLSGEDGIAELTVFIPAIVAPGEPLDIAMAAEGGKLLVDVVGGGADTDVPSPVLEVTGAAEVASEVPHPNDDVPVGAMSMPTEPQSELAKTRAAAKV